MKKATIIFLAVTTFLTVSKSALAWGAEGHMIVARIARQYLKPGVEDSVKKYLGDMTFEKASVWMDEIKSDTTYRYLNPWHYVNVEKGGEYVHTEKPDVINQMKLSIDKLQARNQLKNDEIAFELKVLFHLMGDFHQPLHVGYGTDKGGNDVKLTFGDHQSNLHRVWDSEIIKAEGITADKCLALGKNYNAKEIAKLQKFDVQAWFNDERKLLDAVYANIDNNTVPQTYIKTSEPTIEMQLLLAGIRLAGVFNTAFASK